MKKIYVYIFLFFMGSLLPFIIVEFYFQDYFFILFIVIIACIVFTLSISIEFFKTKQLIQNIDSGNDIDYLNWTNNIKKEKKEASYYFRNIWRY